jgi:hypothetical protein
MFAEETPFAALNVLEALRAQVFGLVRPKLPREEVSGKSGG